MVGFPPLITNFPSVALYSPRSAVAFLVPCSTITPPVPTALLICCAPAVEFAGAGAFAAFELGFSALVKYKSTAAARIFCSADCATTFFSRCARLSESRYVSVPAVTCHNRGFFGPACTATVCAAICPAACGKTARTFPAAFITRASRNSSIESASITESPCHKRACPVYRALPVFEFPCIASAEMFAGRAASCAPLPFVEKSVDRTPPSARISPVVCTKVIREACVSALASRASAFPVSKAVCVARTNVACSSCPRCLALRGSARRPVLRRCVRPFDAPCPQGFRSLELAFLAFFSLCKFHEQFARLQHSRLAGRVCLRFQLHAHFQVQFSRLVYLWPHLHRAALCAEVICLFSAAPRTAHISRSLNFRQPPLGGKLCCDGFRTQICRAIRALRFQFGVFPLRSRRRDKLLCAKRRVQR